MSDSLASTGSPRIDLHAPTPKYVLGVVEGCLAAQPRHRCRRTWHLDAMTLRMEHGTSAVIRKMIVEGAILELDPSWMPGVFFPARAGRVHHRARCRNWRWTPGWASSTRTLSLPTSRAPGTPSRRRACAPETP